MTSSNTAARLLPSSSTDHLPFPPSLSCPLLSRILSLYNPLEMRSFILSHYTLFGWIKSPVFAQKASVKKVLTRNPTLPIKEMEGVWDKNKVGGA